MYTQTFDRFESCSFVREDTAPSYGARWEDIDRAIVFCAKSRAEYEEKEGALLLSAKRVAIHKRFGFATFTEYVEHRLGYDPRTTLEKLRVAESLERLPKTREALRTGARHFSSVRELVRVAVPETEAEWLEATEGKTVRDVERLVSGRKLGDHPTAPKDPRGSKHVVRFELDTETFALVRAALDHVRRETDPSLSEAQALAALCRGALGSETTDEGRAPYQVMLSKCPDCARTTLQSRQEDLEVSGEVAERIGCDAQIIDDSTQRKAQTACSHAEQSAGSAAGLTPAIAAQGRATQTIPPATRRSAIRRAKGGCEVPGCRNRRWLEVHHKTPRCEGGRHDLDDLVVLCGTHHRLNHDGLLWIEGDRACDLVFKQADGTVYGEVTTPESVEVYCLAFSALKNLGISETESKHALAEAKSHVGRNATLQDVITTALRHHRCMQ